MRKPTPLGSAVIAYLALVALGVLLFAAHYSHAQTTTTSAYPTFSWTAPTERTDGSPLAAGDIAGYTLSCDGGVIAKPGATVTTFKLATALAAGAHACSMTVTDTAGTESAMSNTVNFTVVLPPPKAPGTVTVQ